MTERVETGRASLRMSVVIPAYTDQEGLSATLAALARQTLGQSGFEVIVVDNGSPVPLRVPAEAPRNVRMIRCEKPGSYAARNAGVRASSGRILAFTDADCIPAGDWLATGEAAVAALNRPVGGDVLFRAHRKKASVIEHYQIATGFSQAENIAKKGFSATANLFVSREVFSAAGCFEESLLSGGDRVWGWQAWQSGYPVEYVSDAVVWHTCRNSLRSLIRQTRRVAGGRFLIRDLGLARTVAFTTTPHRGPQRALRSLLDYDGASTPRRAGVVLVAAVLWGVRQAETFRLRLGGAPLR